MSTSTDNVQNIIELLKEIDKSNVYNVFLPSLQKEVEFKQLNAEQFKRLIKTVVDSPIYNTEFIITINSIIKENIIDPEINVSNLNVFDKLLFLIKTRIDCISPEYTFNFTDDEVKENDLPENNKTVNLTEHYTNFLSQQKQFPSKELTLDQYSVLCSLPTLSTENKLEKELHTNTKLEISSAEELRTTVGETFINELSKYIEVIKIGETTLSLDTLNFKNRVKVVEQLPTKAINSILKYIEEYKKIVDPLTTYKLDIQGKTITKDLPLDATLFNL
jgi:hypothetical protein